MTPADLATLSLLDPDQGDCPNGHPCKLGETVGERACSRGEYRGQALICWEITLDEIGRAELAGAHARIVAWAQSFVEDRRQQQRST
jgi:hypothetical protein